MSNTYRLSRRALLSGAGVTAASLIGWPGRTAAASHHAGGSTHANPNVVLIMLDDVGYGDWSCYGSETIATPHIDAVAAAGTTFQQMYSAAPVCMPARAALLTGRYPQRVGLPWVTGPGARDGLSGYEQTVGELLRRQGYRTGIFGKWHLGDPALREELSPLDHGFDVFFGTPAFNMDKPFPLYDGERIVDMLDQDEQVWLSRRCTDRALEFVRDNQHRPFFLYLPFNPAHKPYHVEPRFRGSSQAGQYGDLVQQADFHIGRVLAELDDRGLAENTLVMVTSDNGPDEQGTGGLRAGKGTTFEGGIRVPFAIRWPHRIRPGSSYDKPACFTDVLPTVASVGGCTVPTDRPIDGLDLFSPRNESPHDRTLYHYHDWTLNAVRRGRWKLHLPGRENGLQPGSTRAGDNDRLPPLLYDIDADPGEKHDLAGHHPDMVEALTVSGTRFDDEIQAQRAEAIRRARGER